MDHAERLDSKLARDLFQLIDRGHGGRKVPPPAPGVNTPENGKSRRCTMQAPGGTPDDTTAQAPRPRAGSRRAGSMRGGAGGRGVLPVSRSERPSATKQTPSIRVPARALGLPLRDPAPVRSQHVEELHLRLRRGRPRWPTARVVGAEAAVLAASGVARKWQSSVRMMSPWVTNSAQSPSPAVATRREALEAPGLHVADGLPAGGRLRDRVGREGVVARVPADLFVGEALPLAEAHLDEALVVLHRQPRRAATMAADSAARASGLATTRVTPSPRGARRPRRTGSARRRSAGCRGRP